MYISIVNGAVTEIIFFRKAYRKARWKRTMERQIKRSLERDPNYHGAILIL